MDKFQYWNIVKGLGIIAVVLGHASSPVTSYVYMYHLALFFFVSGFLYKDKHSSDLSAYFLSRLRRLWWPMIKYRIAFVLLHNVFFRLNIYSEQALPGILQTEYINTLNIFNFFKSILSIRNLEQMGVAMWFLFPLLEGMVLFCLIRRLTLKISDRKREYIISALVMIIYIIGLQFIENKIHIRFYMDISMLVMPIIYAGFLVEKAWGKFPVKWYLGLIALITVITIYQVTGTSVELTKRQVIGPILFLIVSFCGIYFNLVLAKILGYFPKLGNFIAYIGERSFHIMALHFLMFKIVNWLYVIIYDKPYFWIAKFPIAYSQWWIIYTIVGILGSVACVDFFTYFKSKCIKIYKDVTICIW